jgi:hypothetical protein
MTINEPATLITDYLLAAFTVVLARRLFRAAGEAGSAPRWWWAVAFAATAVAGAAGGTVHGFRDAFGPGVTAPLWILAIEGLLVAAFAVIRATLLGSRLSPAVQRGATLAFGVAFVVYGVWVIGNPRFVFAIAAYGAALAVLVAFTLSAGRTSSRAARWMLAGVAVSALAAVVQQSGWSLHQHFNHNDLYHVIQALGVWLLYRGALVG